MTVECSIRRSLILVALLLTASGCAARDVEGADSAEADAGESADAADASTACEDPEPLTHPVTGDLTGFVRCADGFIHREQAVDTVIPAVPEPCGSSTDDACATHEDCTGAPLGRCVDTPSLLGGCECVYSCESDADCDVGEVCVGDAFTGDVPRCTPAGCTRDADCDDGLCGLAVWSEGCGERFSRLACMSATSDCRMDSCTALDAAECQYADPYTPECLPDDDFAWTCVDRSCAGNCG